MDQRAHYRVFDHGGSVLAESSLAIVYQAVGELIPYARNARTHSEAQIAQIAASIREFGFTNPVLLDGINGILAGHMAGCSPPGCSGWSWCRALSSRI